MKEMVMYAKYNQAGNNTIYSILSGMSNEEREKDRGSYYGNLSGLFRHLAEGTYYIVGMLKPALENNAAAVKAIDSMSAISGEGPLDDAGWKKLGHAVKTIYAAYISMAESLSDSDLKLPVKLGWYDGNPDSVPLSFLLGQLLVHGTHHRGQISQILDTMKIDNDFSMISIPS
jgi:uncharacterized damage-inducible protein DinB